MSSRRERETSTIPTQEPEEMPITNRPIKVLLVEDNKEHMELLERLLGFSEYPAFTVVNATTLAAGIKSLTGKEDIVLLDLSLSDSTGADTFRKMNAAAPTVPIVILSGVSDVTMAIETVQEGAQDYLVKGHVDTHLLLRSIQYAIERKRLQVAALEVNAELEIRVKERTAELEAANEQLQREIGERAHAEEQLVKSNRQLTVALAELRDVQRRSASDRSATAGREVEDALKRVQQHAEIILRAPAMTGNPEKVNKHLRQIVSAADEGRKALRKSRETPDVSEEVEQGKSPAGEVELVLLDAVVERAIGACSPKGKGEAKVAFERKLEADVKIQGDAVQIGELLTHLIRNSMNAIPRRGTITIGARQQDDETILTVQDDGLGMTEAVCQRLLDPSIVTDHADGRPSGYGVIHEVLARHHAKLEIKSRKGIGTTVQVIFPPAKATSDAARSPRVLVVDDDPMIREVISTYLGEDGYSVELAENGRQALEKFDAAEFDIVLTDRSMPEMGGDELAREVKKRNANLPVILLTGFGDIMAAAGEKPAGVDLVVGKPFTMAGLQNVLAKFR
jgi:DNA-binding response OmpR family regulator/anti-sigma regulatory factor (Ser/Thr protein kinase)